MMTKRDLAILSAYTGKLIGSFREYKNYMEEILPDGILFTDDHASRDISELTHDLVKDDFVEVNKKIMKQVMEE